MTEPNFRAATDRLISLTKATEGKFLEAEIMATLVDMYGRGRDYCAKEPTDKKTKIKGRGDAK